MPSWYEDSELMHAGDRSWKNHKYIKKIGDRYFYTMDELRRYGQKAKKSIEDRSGITYKKKAEHYRKQADVYDTRRKMSAARSDLAFEKYNPEYDSWDTRSWLAYNKASEIRKEVQDSQESKNAKMLRERAQEASDRERRFSRSGTKQGDKLAALARTEKEMFLRGAKKYEDALNERLKEAEQYEAKGKTEHERNEAARIRDQEAHSRWRAEYKRAVDYGTEVDDALSRAEEYEFLYAESFAGKLERARNDMRKSFNRVKKTARNYVESGKQKIRSLMRAAEVEIDNLMDNASDTISAGMGWVDSIFKKKKDK